MKHLELSVPQFVVLLDDVAGEDEFDDALNLTRRMTTGAGISILTCTT